MVLENYLKANVYNGQLGFLKKKKWTETLNPPWKLKIHLVICIFHKFLLDDFGKHKHDLLLYVSSSVLRPFCEETILSCHNVTKESCNLHDGKVFRDYAIFTDDVTKAYNGERYRSGSAGTVTQFLVPIYYFITLIVLRQYRLLDSNSVFLTVYLFLLYIYLLSVIWNTN